MKRNPERRSMRNYLLAPGLQLKYVLYFFGFAVVAALLNQMMLVRVLQGSLIDVLASSDLDPVVVAQATGLSLSSALWRMGALFLVLGLGCSLFAIRITHRVVGPQVAFKRHIEALRAGDYESSCRLRRGDHFLETAVALNELALALRERHDEPRSRHLAA